MRIGSIDAEEADEEIGSIPDVLLRAVLELFVVEAGSRKGVDGAFEDEPEAVDGIGGSLEGVGLSCKVWSGLSDPFMPWGVAALELGQSRRLPGVGKLLTRCWSLGATRVGFA